jgi:hypothetical protein
MKKIPPLAKPLIHRDLRRKSEVFGYFEKILIFSKIKQFLLGNR